MTAQLTKIKGTGADAVLLWNAGREAATVAKNMAVLDLGIPLIGSHGNARIEFIEGAGDAAEDFVFAAGKVLVPEAYGEDSEEYAVATDFIDRYTERFGKAPDTFAGHAYDALLHHRRGDRAPPEEFTSEELARRDRGYKWVRGNWWSVHLLADRPQRARRGRSGDVPDIRWRVGARE
jgi:ABC-type branched-subunit amino acid transport system substrate-binding protein